MTATIGQCRVCLGRPCRIDPSTGACVECLSRRGRRWVALCIRAREDETFRISIRAYLTEPRARKLFDKMFGSPLREVGE
jgi:hypothetical protein